jgi:cation transport ATPase
VKHQYKVNGMTCGGCVRQVENILRQVDGVEEVDVNLSDHLAAVKMKEHISTAKLNEHLSSESHYSLEDHIPAQEDLQSASAYIPQEENKSKWETYRPLILIFIFLVLVSTITSREGGTILWREWMHSFMAGFFITFSFFKFLDLKGFANSYAMYDLLAKRVRSYGYVYPFLELGLGLAYLAGVYLTGVYIATIVLMGFSTIGVVQAALSKTTIRCACLGVVFNLPMSTVTVIENGLMIAMAAAMLLMA